MVSLNLKYGLLGNRSLLGDVRYDIKDTVNKIKKRELFRPFEFILEEYDETNTLTDIRMNTCNILVMKT